MQRLTIRRALSDEQGTLGVVFVDREFFCFSIELPWRFNAREISCFPAGEYRLLYTLSPRLKIRTYEVVDVPSRSGIRIHSGNLAGDKIRGWESHSLGCPLFGERQGALKTPNGRAQRAVMLSRQAIQRMENALDRRAGVLEVLDVA